MSANDHKGWYSRKGLPHFDGGEVTQFITFRLGDSLPKATLVALSNELNTFKGNLEREKHERIEMYLDQGSGSCIMREPKCAQIVQDALIYLDQKRYELLAWVVMPNHVHFLARFHQGQTLAAALHSLKSYTSNELKKIHPELDAIWQKESFDRYIRNEEHYLKTVNYIHENPCKAGLCHSVEDFPFSSRYKF